MRKTTSGGQSRRFGSSQTALPREAELHPMGLLKFGFNGQLKREQCLSTELDRANVAKEASSGMFLESQACPLKTLSGQCPWSGGLCGESEGLPIRVPAARSSVCSSPNAPMPRGA